MLRFLTAGESHGKGLVAVVEGLPAGVPVREEEIAGWLRRRQGGYGRGGRMQIERDQAEILSGVRHGLTLGSPVSLLIRNADWPNWERVMSPEELPETEHGAGGSDRAVTRPRPGHGDLAGALKYGTGDIRNILERASARETAARVAAASLAARLLAELGIFTLSCVEAIGGEGWNPAAADPVFQGEPGTLTSPRPGAAKEPGSLRDRVAGWRSEVEVSPVSCPDPEASRRMIAAIDRARGDGDTLGGVFRVVALGVPPGLGSHVHWDRRLDARLAAAMVGIPAIKGVEIGWGFEAARRPGSEVHDEIFWDPDRGFYRGSNHAGGTEAGMSNGEAVWVRAAMKPIATLYRPLRTVDLTTGEEARAAVERSDICAVPAACVVGEAMACWVLAEAVLEKFGGDSLPELRQNFETFAAQARRMFPAREE